MSVTDIIAITGASSGIGAATARLLAARGHRLALGARRTDRLQQLAEELPTEAIVHELDVRDRENVAAFVRETRDHFGRLDVLVNNAGIGPLAPLAERRVDDWDAMIDINLRGVLYGIAAALPVFEAQGFGHVVVTASTAAYRITPTMAVYSATKNAVRIVCETLRQESDGRVRVTVVSPGMTRTPFADGSPQFRDLVADIGMDPEAVGAAIAYAIEQPPEVEVGEVVVRPAAQR